MPDAPKKLPLSAWNAETIRLTLFAANPPLPLDHDWFEKLIDDGPEIDQRLPKQQARQQEGPFASGRFLIRTELTRVDLIYVPTQEIVAAMDHQNPLPEALSVFNDLVGSWLTGAPPAMRLAMGVVASIPRKTETEALTTLAAWVSRVRVDSVMEDFLFQVNYPRTSRSILDLKMNRLSKWYVAGLHRVVLNPQSNPAPPLPPLFLARVETDVDTDARRTERLPALSDLAAELASLTEEIVSNGDAQ